jgi:AsmA protein
LALLVLLLLALLVVTLLRIPLDLSRYKPLAEDAMSEALGRQVSIDGDMVVTTSLWPYFELGGLRIANPVDFPQGDLAVMDRARISVGILPLLQRRVEIRWSGRRLLPIPPRTRMLRLGGRSPCAPTSCP